MWPFKKDTSFTGVKILVTNYCDLVDVKKVFDVGSGPYIHTYVGTPRYMAKNGEFETDYRNVNGDAKSWRRHIGDAEGLFDNHQ